MKTRSAEGVPSLLDSWSVTVETLAGLAFFCLVSRAAVSSSSSADQHQTRYPTPRQKMRASLTSSAELYDRLAVLTDQASSDAS